VKSLGALLPRLRTRARRFIDRPREEWTPLSRAGLLTVHVLVSCARKLQRDRAAQMASALSFQTLFSLLPLLVLVLLVLHSVRGLETASTELRTMIVEFLVPESLIGDQNLEGPPEPGEPSTVQEFNDARTVLRRRIDSVLEELSSVSFAGVGVAGFLLFLYGSTALVRTVESSFNLLYQADDPPPWSRLPLYFTLLTLGPFALVGAQILQDKVLENLDTFMGGWMAAPFAYLTPLLVSCLVLILALRTIPNTWVAWRAAAIGGTWGGLAWFAFQEIFGYYVNNVSMVSLYGALALIPLFLLWVYWSWVLILAGVALAFIIQYLPADEHWARRLILPSDPRLLVPIMVRVADAFTRGEKITTARLSLELGMPPRILRPYVRVLETQGYVRGLRDRVDQHVLTMARPPESIKVRELLALAPPVKTPVAPELIEDLRDAELAAAGDLTLEELVARSNVATVGPVEKELVEEPERKTEPRPAPPPVSRSRA
jgi:YihY family inner membrane protein